MIVFISIISCSDGHHLDSAAMSGVVKVEGSFNDGRFSISGSEAINTNKSAYLWQWVFNFNDENGGVTGCKADFAAPSTSLSGFTSGPGSCD